MAVDPADQSRVEVSLANISSALWRIRELLDLLTFKLETEQVLVASGRSRWLAQAAHEVELVLDEIRHAELLRTVELGDVAQALGLAPEISLLELAAAAPPPWDHLLADHRAMLLRATTEISALAESNHELLSSSYQALQVVLGTTRDALGTTRDEGPTGHLDRPATSGATPPGSGSRCRSVAAASRCRREP